MKYVGTITFDPEKEGSQIAAALDYFQYQLKGISFLPRISYGAYPQMPYEEISEDQYIKILGDLKQDGIGGDTGVDGENERFCDGDSCVRN